MIEVKLDGQGRCTILHGPTGATIRSSMAPEYGGIGGAFSSTDLVAAALGSCIATNLERVAVRHGVGLERIRLTVDKTLRHEPKSIGSLDVAIYVDGDLDPDLRTRLERAAEHCVVHRSLSDEVDVTIRFA